MVWVLAAPPRRFRETALDNRAPSRDLYGRESIPIRMLKRAKRIIGIADHRFAGRPRCHGHLLRLGAADLQKPWEHEDLIERPNRHGVRFCYVGSNADVRVNCGVAEAYLLSSADRADVLLTVAEG